MVAKLLLGVAALSLAGAAQATSVPDGTGDFLSGYTGSRNANLDITNFSVVYNAATLKFTVTTTFAGLIQDDLSASTLYVLGVDTGAHTAHFTDIINGGVDFSQAFQIKRDGTTANSTIDGNTLTTVISLSSLASTGADPLHYGFSLWSKDSSKTGNAGLGDFSPNGGNIAAVPEPASWALMLGGFGLVGGAMRRRRTSVRFA
jgi:hypothetical protein